MSSRVKGGLHDEILRGKDHHLPNFFFYGVIAAFVFNEESTQAFWRHVRPNIGGINTSSRLVDGVLVQIRRKNLQRTIIVWFDLFENLLKDNRKGIGLFSRRASSGPCSEGSRLAHESLTTGE